MLASQEPSTELFDVVILGAGAAGITLAMQLGQAGIRTALVEGGGYERTSLSQALYEGFNKGIDYPLAGYRLRFFGGTTNHWSGWCRPLAPATFTANESIDYPGWAIDPSQLSPYLESALDILDVDRPTPWKPSNVQQQTEFNQQLAQGGFEEVYWHWSLPTRFKDKYLEQLQQDHNVTLSVNDSLVDFEFTAEGEITGAVLRHIQTGALRTVYGKLFVMACGAIENARLLLHINAKHAVDFGNRSGQLGNNFMEHPHIFDVGKVVFFDSHYTHDTSGGLYAYRFICPTDTLARQKNILRAVIRLRIFNTQEDRQPIINELSRVTYLQNLSQLQFGNLDIVGEQMPTLANTIRLSDEVDALGIGKPVLNWELTDLDYTSLRVTLLEFAKMMIDENMGRCKLASWVTNETVPHVFGGGHQMGTTRMAQHESEGVVDTDCKLFGTTNLYMAGSSVFTTGGYANPTLTIVQLALRMVDHLKTILSEN